MTARQVRASFAAHAVPSVEDSINRAIAAQKKRLKENPNEARELLLHAGVITPTGRWAKPYRMLMKRDLEEQAARANTRG